MALKIEDGTDHVKVTFDDTNESRIFLQKGTFYLKRIGDDFFFLPYASNVAPLVRFSYTGGSFSDVVDTSAPSHASADALETALIAFIFN